MGVIVKCKEGIDKHCPYLGTCLARLTDRTITGCGVPLFIAGLIMESEIVVEHTVADTADDAQNAQE